MRKIAREINLGDVVALPEGDLMVLEVIKDPKVIKLKGYRGTKRVEHYMKPDEKVDAY